MSTLLCQFICVFPVVLWCLKSTLLSEVGTSKSDCLCVVPSFATSDSCTSSFSLVSAYLYCTGTMTMATGHDDSLLGSLV